jgi:hypothetical protein
MADKRRRAQTDAQVIPAVLSLRRLRSTRGGPVDKARSGVQDPWFLTRPGGLLTCCSLNCEPVSSS